VLGKKGLGKDRATAATLVDEVGATLLPSPAALFREP
jgi:hypothetical protein